MPNSKEQIRTKQSVRKVEHKREGEEGTCGQSNGSSSVPITLCQWDVAPPVQELEQLHCRATHCAHYVKVVEKRLLNLEKNSLCGFALKVEISVKFYDNKG